MGLLGFWERPMQGKGILRVHDRFRSLFHRPSPPPTKDGRHIKLDVLCRTPLTDERTGKAYVSNKVHSSRYTIWDFLPRQIFFQFTKLANLYLLIIALLQFIPGLSPTSNYTGIIPLLVMISISMGKEGYDDFRRHKLDKAENNNQIQCLKDDSAQTNNSRSWFSRKPKIAKRIPNPTGTAATDPSKPLSWQSVKWEDAKVGDVIKLCRDDDAPADIVLLYADGPNGVAYVETASLDGETSLKSKQACASLSRRCGTLDDLSGCNANVVVEDPNIDLYEFKGRVEIYGECLPLDMNGVILRGSTLRNTPTAIGVIANTGEECRIRMNANKNIRTKSPELQKIVNRVVLLVVVFVISLVVYCTTRYQFWTRKVENNAWYLNGAHFILAYAATANVLLLNTFIPLALYVSLEIVKVGQIWQQHQDVDMYDAATDTPMQCNTSTILENLGQINYVFADKTGTLTDNVMRFRGLSVGGYAWLHDSDTTTKNAKHSSPAVIYAHDNVSEEFIELQDYPVSSSNSSEDGSASTSQPSRLRTADLLKQIADKPRNSYSQKTKLFLVAIALCHTCISETGEDGNTDFQSASPDEVALVRAAQEMMYLELDRTTNTITLSLPGATPERYEILEVIEFSTKRRRMSVIVRFPDGKICLICKGADSTLIPLLKFGTLAEIKADEVVRKSSIHRAIEGEEALHKMSERKASGQDTLRTTSPRVQKVSETLQSWFGDSGPHISTAPRTQSPPPGGQLHRMESQETLVDPSNLEDPNTWPSSVGTSTFDAVLDESAVFERCFQHLNEFATEGLRTLLYGHRFLSTEVYNNWKKQYVEATTSLVGRQARIEVTSEIIEKELQLTGATAIEDRLQAGCAQTIEKLRKANIKVWMLTGDKRETAINIGHSAGICKTYSEIVILNNEAEKIEQRMSDTLAGFQRRAFAHTVVVIDGQTLTEIDAVESLAALFFDLVVLADSVICCRASPGQKASLVRRTRELLKKDSVTLAIGDGANDIPMILEAHVGIGVSGKEGLQAARISDYSIAQFRFLQKLLFVHGHWNYVRTARYLLFTFWKEAAFFLMQAHYQNFTGYTSTSLFDSPALTVFNTLFSSLCVIVYGVYEQDLAASTLLAIPELYIYTQRGEAFSYTKFFAWFLLGVGESSVMFWLMWRVYGSVLSTVDNGMYGMGDICLGVAIILINTKVLILEMHNKTIITAISYGITIVGWFAFNLFLSGVVKVKDTRTYNIRGNFLYHIGRSIEWWCAFICLLVAVMGLELAILSIRKTFWPSDIEVFQELQNDTAIKSRLEEAAGRSAVAEELVKDGTTKPKDREAEMQGLLRSRKIAESSGNVESSGAQIRRICAGGIRTRKTKVNGNREA